MIQAFPRLLTTGPDGLTPEQWAAISAHRLIDDGAALCSTCDAVVRSAPYCGTCGGALTAADHPSAGRKVRTCAKCSTPSQSTFCASCGERLVPKSVEDVEQGRTTHAELYKRMDAIRERINAGRGEPDARERHRQILARVGVARQ